MVRRVVIVTLVLGALVGTYFAVGGWPTPEQGPVNLNVTPLPPLSTTPAKPVLLQDEKIRATLAGSLALMPGHGFPCGLAWQPLLFIGASGGFTEENLVQCHPLLFLQLCKDRVEREVHGYRCTFVKRERIDGKLYPKDDHDYEVIKIACREDAPFAVLFEWKKHQKRATKALYVNGENNNNILAMPSGILAIAGVQKIPLDDPNAKNSGRYTMAQFGMVQAIQRTVARLESAKARGVLHLRADGRVDLDGRPCYKFIRDRYQPPEKDGLQKELIGNLTLYIDMKTWLQVGSILDDPDGTRVAEYYFRDIELNPAFDAKQFTASALK
jgi:hypothetical protein